MWTNIFRISDFNTISWFQFLPIESDASVSFDRSSISKTELKDAASYHVLSAHIYLQKEGFLSTWTNSFVGPWDPSQGVHNPDEKIKLWLFLPGRHSTIIDSAQVALSRLRVVANGQWVAPGDSEVSVALCQALRNSLERAMKRFSYVRFGDIFTRYNPTRSENSFSRSQLLFEFVFSATEEAIYAHVVVSARYIRNLCSDDIEKLLVHSSQPFDGLPVVVSPNGMLGRLIGCCPSELVRQVYFSKSIDSNGLGTGSPNFNETSGFLLRGQRYYVEVSLGCRSHASKTSQLDNNESNKQLHSAKDLHQGQVLEKIFIFPPEAIVIPMLHHVFSHFSTRRLWLQNWMGNLLWERWPFWNFSDSSFFENCSYLEASSKCSVDPIFLRLKKQLFGSSNSISSGVSSVSSTSSESEHEAVDGDLEADADSLAHENSSHKMCRKRTHGDMIEVSTLEGKSNLQDSLATLRTGFLWGREDDRLGVDINVILAEFGDFGDFFQDEPLFLGEPPGTAESHALVLAATDLGDIMSGCTDVEMIDQGLQPAGVVSSDVPTSQQSFVAIEDSVRASEPQKDVMSPTRGQLSTVSNGKYDFLMKAEAMMMFAPEFAAVEIPNTDISMPLFATPYLPRSRRASSSGATSRVYPYDMSDYPSRSYDLKENPEKSQKLQSGARGYEVGLSKLYTLIQHGKKGVDGKSNNVMPAWQAEKASVSGANSQNSSLMMQKQSEKTFDIGSFLLSMKTGLATGIELAMFQAAMCRIRHTLVAARNGSGHRSSMSYLVQNDTIGKSSVMIPNYDIKKEVMVTNYEIKKENAAVKLASSIDSDLYDGSQISQVGVWQSIGVPKAMKPLDVRATDSFPSVKLSGGITLNACTQRQPLLDLLYGMSLLVQQSTSFVDIALDMDDGDSPYFWLSLEEQKRRGFSCDPRMVHAGCGGLFASSHSMDYAGIDLVDPLAADVSPSSVISALQSDIKAALRTAFGNIDGPLSINEWCRGRSISADSLTTDGYYMQYSSGEMQVTSSSLVGDSMSPSRTISASSSSREVIRSDDLSQRRFNQETATLELETQKGDSRYRPTSAMLPMPSLLVGYQDDWLKTSANCIKAWEKAPLEPYASPKPVMYYAMCPDAEIIMASAADFFQQLGTVYEICNLGTHSPHSVGVLDVSPGKSLPAGIVPVDCPEQVKVAGGRMNIISSVADYLHAISKYWNVKSFITSLSKKLGELKITSNTPANQKESSSGPCTVVYVVCPFPEPSAVLQILVECSVALGTIALVHEKEKRSILFSHVAKALNCITAADEASNSNVIMLSGIGIPKLALQIVPMETFLRLNTMNSELAVLKDIAFTVYNKIRRIPRSTSSNDMFQSALQGRPQSTLMHGSSPLPTLRKDCLVPRMTSSEFDAALRPQTWDGSWQSTRATGLSELSRFPDACVQDDKRYIFEPLFILSEPGTVEQNTVAESSNVKTTVDESTAPGTSIDPSRVPGLEGSDHDQQAPGFHCCYGWTEDWRWLVCVWTDSRGELLDSFICPFGGISNRQDTKVLQSLFVQVLQHGFQVIYSLGFGIVRPRDIVIARIGGFFELEIQEWQKAICSFAGNEVKKFPIQLRRLIPEGVTSSANGPMLQPQEIGLIQERSLSSTSSHSVYGSHPKSSFMKTTVAQSASKKHILAGQAGIDNTRSSLQLVQSITLVSVLVDHSLHIILQADASSGGANQAGNSFPPYLEGFTAVKSVGSMSSSHLLIPSPSMRYLSPTTLQLPTCLTSESPPLVHLLHSKGYASPLATGYVISRAVPLARKDFAQPVREDWPSVLTISLIDHYGSGITNAAQDKIAARGGSSMNKLGRFTQEAAMSRDYQAEGQAVLEFAAAELNALSWMSVSPVYPDRRTALPIHCDMVQRLARLLHYADKELSRPPDKTEQA